MGDTVTYGRCKFCGLICDCPHPIKTEEGLNKRIDEEINIFEMGVSHWTKKYERVSANLKHCSEKLEFWKKEKEKRNSSEIPI